jgi:hypothetical protein
LVLGGAALVAIRKSQTLSDVVSEFLARGFDPPPIVFGPRLITALGLLIAIIGIIAIAVGLNS